MQEITEAIVDFCERDAVYAHNSLSSQSVLHSAVLNSINDESIPIGATIQTKNKKNSNIDLLEVEPQESEKYIWGRSMVQQYGFSHSDMYNELNVTIPDSDSPFVMAYSSKKIAITGRNDGTFCCKYNLSNLRSMASSQLGHLFLVDVDSRRIDEKTEYNFYDVTYYTGFDLDAWTNMILNGTIKLNVDMEVFGGDYNNNGSVWFVESSMLSNLYSDSYNLMDDYSNDMFAKPTHNHIPTQIEDDWATYDRPEIDIEKTYFDDSM